MNSLTIRADAATLQKMEDVAVECQLGTLNSLGQFEQTFKMAAGIQALDALMTAGMMKDIMALQGRPIGFRTDKDASGGYPLDVVKDCVIEAVIRGLRTVGNEFNIIAGRLYITKEGMARLVKEYPGLANLKLNLGVPSTQIGGALVECTASWSVDGTPSQLTRIIPIRVNKGMGADAILGKATRKLLASVYGQLTGSEHALPEGDVIDVDHTEAVGGQVAADVNAALGACPTKAPDTTAKQTDKPLNEDDSRLVDEYRVEIDKLNTAAAVDAIGNTAKSSDMSPAAKKIVAGYCDNRRSYLTRGERSNR